MFIMLGRTLKNISEYSEITEGADGNAVLTRKSAGVAHVLKTSIDFDDLVKQMKDGGVLIAPLLKRTAPPMAKTQPTPQKRAEEKGKPAPATEKPATATKAANGKPAETDLPKLDLGKKPEAPKEEKPKVIEAKKPAHPKPEEPNVNEKEPDYLGKVDDRGDGNNENGNGGE